MPKGGVIPPFGLLCVWSASCAQATTTVLGVPDISNQPSWIFGAGFKTRIVQWTMLSRAGVMPAGETATAIIKIDDVDMSTSFQALRLDDAHGTNVSSLPLDATDGFVIDSSAASTGLAVSVLTSALTGTFVCQIAAWGYRFHPSMVG